jgi:hypothetical protein
MYVYVYAEFLLWYMLWQLSSELPRLVSRRFLHCLLFVSFLTFECIVETYAESPHMDSTIKSNRYGDPEVNNATLNITAVLQHTTI